MNVGAPILNTTCTWKAAYGTFLTSLLLEYWHDQVANQAVTQFNVTWARTSPIAVAIIDDPYNTYLTLECDHGMGMTIVGNADDVYAFNFVCSSAISPLEYGVFQSMFPGTLFDGSATLGLSNMLLNNSSLEIYTSNGYVVVKATNSTDKILVIDPETGIVRDILLNSTIFGAYCYYDLQTELAVDLGESLLSSNCDWFTFLSGLVTSMGIGVIKEVIKDRIGSDVPPDRYKLALGLALTFMGGYGQYYFSEFHSHQSPETATQLCVDYIFSIIGVKVPVQFTGVRITTGYIDIGLLFGAESRIVQFTTVEFFEYGTSMGVLKVFGQTPKEVVLKIANEYFNGEIRSLIINKIFWIVDETGKFIPQYDSTYYNNSTEYLTTPQNI